MCLYRCVCCHGIAMCAVRGREEEGEGGQGTRAPCVRHFWQKKKTRQKNFCALPEEGKQGTEESLLYVISLCMLCIPIFVCYVWQHFYLFSVCDMCHIYSSHNGSLIFCVMHYFSCEKERQALHGILPAYHVVCVSPHLYVDML